MSYIDEQISNIIKSNPNDVEFHQAVIENLRSVEEFLELNPIYKEYGIVQRIVEPDRQIKFKVTWRDDHGKIRVNRGYRVQFNNTIGPYKGGLRFHPSVNLSIIKFLGFEQIFKNALTGLPIGGGKGGSDFDPKGKSENEIMSFCQSFMSELYKYIGPDKDVPAGDIGVGAKEVGYLFGQYKRLTTSYSGVLTGKGLDFGGSLIRKEATGYGLLYIVQEFLSRKNLDIRGMEVSISGAGNVAIHAAQKAISMGGKVVTMSDSTGWIYDNDGIDIMSVKKVKEVRKGRIKEYLSYRPHAKYMEGRFDWSAPCRIALPCATQNELNQNDAKNLINNNVIVVAEGANMPTTSEAIELLFKNGVCFLPGKAANAGGVAVSSLEMSQNSMRVYWGENEVDIKLKDIMRSIFNTISSTADQYDFSGDYVKGANIAGFKKVADAMIMQGLV